MSHAGSCDLFPLLTADGPTQMAADDVLLEHAVAAGRPVLRFYTWDPPAVSLGRFQSIVGIDQEYVGAGVTWPDPWKSGSRKPQAGRTDGPKPRLELIRHGESRTRHARWTPEGVAR